MTRFKVCVCILFLRRQRVMDVLFGIDNKLCARTTQANLLLSIWLVLSCNGSNHHFFRVERVIELMSILSRTYKIVMILQGGFFAYDWWSGVNGITVKRRCS